jgi:hypothetical protein
MANRVPTNAEMARSSQQRATGGIEDALEISATSIARARSCGHDVERGDPLSIGDLGSKWSSRDDETR